MKCTATLTTATVKPCPRPFILPLSDGTNRTVCGAAKQGCDGTTHTTTYTLTCEYEREHGDPYGDTDYPEHYACVDGMDYWWCDGWKGSTPHVEPEPTPSRRLGIGTTLTRDGHRVIVIADPAGFDDAWICRWACTPTASTSCGLSQRINPVVMMRDVGVEGGWQVERFVPVDLTTQEDDA